MMFARGLTIAGLIICMAATSVFGSPTLGLSLVEVEYCAILDANTCLSMVAHVQASLSRNKALAADDANTVEVAATACLETGRPICSENGLVCVSPRGSLADGRLLCIGITINAALLPERVLGDFVVIRVNLDAADSTNTGCSSAGPATVTLDTSCLGPLTTGNVFPVGHIGFFKITRVYPPNCGQPIFTEPSSWGAIKSLYR